MNDPNAHLKVFLTTLSWSLPIIIVSICALMVTAGRRKRFPKASLWALLGFSLVLVLCFSAPIEEQVIISDFMSGNTKQHESLRLSIRITSKVLEAIAYTFLLVAVFIGRGASDQVVAQPSANSSVRRAIGAVLAAVGIVFIIFGVTVLNSMESQLKRGVGGEVDVNALACFIVGIPAFLCGVFFAVYPFNESQPASVNSQAADTPEERLQRLADLRQRGIITELEVEQQRAKILSGL
jgi:cytochrome c biogenesis protein CcdA